MFTIRTETNWDSCQTDYLGLKTQTLPDHSLKNASWECQCSGRQEHFKVPLLQFSPFSYIISFVETSEELKWKGYLYAVLMLLVTILRGVINQQHFMGKLTVGLRIRSALNAAVYRKVKIKSARKQAFQKARSGLKTT